MVLLASALTTLIAERTNERYEEQLFRQSKLLGSRMLKRVEGVDEEYVVRVRPVGVPNKKVAGDGARRPSGDAGLQKELRILPKAFLCTISMGAIAGHMRYSDKQKITQLDKDIEHETREMSSLIGQSIISSATRKCTGDATWSGTAADDTVTLTFADGSGMFANAAIDWVDVSDTSSHRVRIQSVTPAAVGASSARVGVSVVLINDVVDPATGAVVALGSVDVTAADDLFAVVPGTYLGFDGNATATGDNIQSLNDMSGTASFQGLDPASGNNGIYNWTGQTFALSAAIMQDQAQAHLAFIGTRSGSYPDVVVAAPQVANAISQNPGNQSTIYGKTASAATNHAKPVGGDFDVYGMPLKKGTGIKCGGADVVDDIHCPSHIAYAFNSDHVELLEYKKLGLEVADMGANRSRTHYQDDVFLDAQLQLVTDLRSCVGALTTITGQ